ncbi:response regulator [Hoyosella rhizosphaerae]|uniref:Response regulatory domain-containing protein n=1 Tax=Hoyosella rhizosphaerae TaxID=1755582 RepID=A0A916XF59_9ACTN|nr:response regulator [Hoyosella rhizosphaerae]MBN4925832.1 response regulator [Hoyosella rhizosphaerae]GGC67603.1 hypothetical protein GCM10011410_20380 [Hoyosella rhizosphaerae]
MNGAQTDLPTVLVVDDEVRIRKAIRVGLTKAGMHVIESSDGIEALERLTGTRPDVIVSDLMMPRLDGLELLKSIRADPDLAPIPVLMLTAKAEISDRVEGLRHGADDYIAKPFAIEELVARVKGKLERPPVPVADLPGRTHRRILSNPQFRDELDRELFRVSASRRTGIVAELDIHESAAIVERLGPAYAAQLWTALSDRFTEIAEPLDLVGRSRFGGMNILLPETSPEAGRKRLQNLSRAVNSSPFEIGGETIHVTPVIGYTPLADTSAELVERAHIAREQSRLLLDLEPLEWDARMHAPAPTKEKGMSWLRPLVTPFELVAVFLIAFVLPLIAYVAFDRYVINIVPAMYILVVVALLGTAIFIWIEGLLAMREEDPPPWDGPYPPAAAIIAAFLPNEAATIVDTVHAFLRVDYPGDLEVVLAYNTPAELPVEAALRELARENPRLTLLNVPDSTSKAQNVNFAVSRTRSDMVGIFDADHHPDPISFTRAWQWIAAGNDIVQGHCLVRNGDASWVARTVAVEFETIYAVAHPGRARMHDFGIFGGSNGYWRGEVLRNTRMHGFMLTEDIDSSIRSVTAGRKIVNDPLIISRELAPVTLKSLWNQRLRWAQGWFEVTLEHAISAIRSRNTSVRQKLGIFHLLVWREIYPWLALQVFPILAFMMWKAGGAGELDYLIPIFILTTIFTVATGPAVTIITYLLSHPDIRQNKRWFLWYALVSIAYVNFRNAIAMVSQLRHIRGDVQWRVTPRDAA